MSDDFSVILPSHHRFPRSLPFGYSNQNCACIFNILLVHAVSSTHLTLLLKCISDFGEKTLRWENTIKIYLGEIWCRFIWLMVELSVGRLWTLWLTFGFDTVWMSNYQLFKKQPVQMSGWVMDSWCEYRMNYSLLIILFVWFHYRWLSEQARVHDWMIVCLPCARWRPYLWQASFKPSIQICILCIIWMTRYAYFVHNCFHNNMIETKWSLGYFMVHTREFICTGSLTEWCLR